MGTHPIFESDFNCLTEKMKNRTKETTTTTHLNICERSRRSRFMLLYSTANRKLHDRFTKIMKMREKTTKGGRERNEIRRRITCESDKLELVRKDMINQPDSDPVKSADENLPDKEELDKELDDYWE